jgi:hypothetical protein
MPCVLNSDAFGSRLVPSVTTKHLFQIFMQHRTLSRKRSERGIGLLLTLIALLAIEGCGGFRASEDIPVGVDLSGRWKKVTQLTDQSKQQLDAAIDAMHQQRERRMRSMGRIPTEREAPFADLPMSAPFPPPQQTRKQLEDMVLPPPTFELKQSVGSIEFIYPGDREARRLRPGATMAIGFLQYDEANVVCGWKSHAFVIETRAPELVTILETYELIDKGQHLRVTVKSGGALVKPLELQAVYERS